jgi:hypothetical protein
MIDRPEGWTWALCDSGILLTSAVGRIRYQDQLRPLRRVRDIVATLPVRADWHGAAPLTIERLLTHEHEHAALATLEGRVGDQPARRVVGVVVLDDSFTIVDGIAAGTDHLEDVARTVRELTVADTHMLGERRRRFVYRPPGWNGFSLRPHHAYFLAPGYPENGVYMVAFPAQPRVLFPGDARALVGSLNQKKGWNHGPLRPLTEEVANAHGLSGVLFEADVREGKVEATRVFAVLEDQRYLYPLLVEAPPARMADAVPTFLGVVASVEPIPGATRTAAVSHWVE